MTETVPFKVRLPFGEEYSTETISSTKEEVGNAVAEGRLHPSMFWPTLCRIYACQLKALQKEKVREFDSLLEQLELARKAL